MLDLKKLLTITFMQIILTALYGSHDYDVREAIIIFAMVHSWIIASLKIFDISIKTIAYAFIQLCVGVIFEAHGIIDNKEIMLSISALLYINSMFIVLNYMTS